jgi:general secretion pathway protein A
MLVGQPELADLLARPELRQLRQRIVLRHRLRPFDERETNHYVDERLRLAGYTGKALFKNSALRELFRVTGGIPRLINVVCDGALLLGYGRDLATLDADAIREVARDLELIERSEPAGGAEARSAGSKRGLFAWLRRASGGR